MRPLLLLALLFSSLLMAQNPTPDEGEVRIEKRLDRYVSRMKQKSVGDLWRYCAKVEDLGEEVIPLIKQRVDQEDEKVQLGLSKVLISLGDREFAMEILMDLLEDSEDLKIKIPASQLVASDGFATMKEDILTLMQDSEEPILKIYLAQACWQIGNRSKEVLNTLTKFLSHEDQEITNIAGLALAEMGEFQIAEEVLSRLKSEPSLRGRLVRIYLEQKRIEKEIKNYKAEVKNTGVTGESKGDPVEEVKSLVLNNFAETNEEVDVKSFTEYAGKGMTTILDTHTSLWTPEEYKKFADSIDQAYAGIGAFVGIRDGQLRIASPVYSGPAYKSGIRSGDLIIAVGGEATKNASVDDVIKKLKGKVGEIIILSILRRGWKEPRDFKVIRSVIEIPSCRYELLPGKIGYFQLTQFGEKTGRELKKALKELSNKGMKSCIIDLRNNGGGYMVTAKEIVEQFLERSKIVVWSEGRDKAIAPKTTMYSTSPNPRTKIPLVCLINEGSASSSEITAGALKDHKRAILVGTRSYGKGTVQQPLPLNSWVNGYLKLTIAKYYLPSGKCVHKEKDPEGNIIPGKEGGIIPDIVVEAEEDESWVTEAFNLVMRTEKLDDYVEKNYLKHKELFTKLATNDYLDPTRYPDFDELYQSLNTKATKNHVRRWLRSLIQTKVADDRGKIFVGNFNEDNQLQRAIVEILKKQKEDPQKIVEYSAFLDKYKDNK